jgi:hypothetical protein
LAASAAWSITANSLIPPAAIRSVSLVTVSGTFRSLFLVVMPLAAGWSAAVICGLQWCGARRFLYDGSLNAAPERHAVTHGLER